MCCPDAVRATALAPPHRAPLHRAPPPPASPPTRRRALAAAVAATAAALGGLPGFLDAQRPRPSSRPARHIPAAHLVDLTHPLNPEFPYIPVPGLTHEFRAAPVATVEQNGVYALRWELVEHIGTHIDAPSHFDAAQPNLEALPADAFVAPIAVLDVRAQARRDHDYAVTPDDVLRWERRHGRLPDGAAVFMNSGWDALVGDPRRFLGTDASGTLHFPGFAAETCAFLVRERAVRGVGVDTVSFDIGPDAHFTAHKALFAGGKWGIENIAGLDRIPPAGATALIGAIPVVGASGSPIRLLAAFD